MLRIVLDTNALLRSLSRKSAYKIIIDKLYENAYHLYLTNDVLLEYEEKITEIFSKETAELTTGAFSLLSNVHKIDIHYNLRLIDPDADDNKFVDCAFAANAHYIVTDDKHFNKLATVTFPKINVISLARFKEVITLDSPSQ
jgi:uncharacterized protein